MTTEWIELPDLQAVAIAQSKDWEIECYAGGWDSWVGRTWHFDLRYRGRPRRPKMKKVKMLCYLVDNHRLSWLVEQASVTHGMIRIPAEDKTIEIPEGV